MKDLLEQMIHQKTHILGTEQPRLRWGTSAVHHRSDPTLERLDVTLSIVLLLLVGFTLPALNKQGTEKILHTLD